MLYFAESPTRRKSSASPIVRSMFSPAWEIFPRCRMTDYAYKFITAACCFVMNFKPTPQKGCGIALFCGVTDPDEIKRFPYRPKHVLSGVGDIPALPDD